jgi:hypothetical protein
VVKGRIHDIGYTPNGGLQLHYALSFPVLGECICLMPSFGTLLGTIDAVIFGGL